MSWDAAHGAVEVGCAGVGLLVGSRIVRVASRDRARRWLYAFGLSLIVAAALDLVHAGVSVLPSFAAGRRSPLEHVVPWTGSLGRLWMIAGASRSWLARRGVSYRFGLRTSGLVEIGGAMLVLSAVLLLSLPSPYVTLWPHRPLDAMLAVPFAALAIAYRRDRALWPLFALEALSAAAVASSTGQHDAGYLLAHVAKVAAYGWLWRWYQVP